MNDLLAQMQAQGGGQELQEWLSELQLEAAGQQEAGEARRSTSLTPSAGAAAGESGEQEAVGDSASEGYTSGGTSAASSGWSSAGDEDNDQSD
jgi:hypothetical protein